MPSLPKLEEMHAQRAKDLGGDWSYFDFTVNSTTETQRFLLTRPQAVFADSQILQPVFEENYKFAGWEACKSIDEIKSDRFSIVFDNGQDLKFLASTGEISLAQLLPGAMIVDIDESGFQYKLHKYTNVHAP